MIVKYISLHTIALAREVKIWGVPTNGKTREVLSIVSSVNFHKGRMEGDTQNMIRTGLHVRCRCRKMTDTAMCGAKPQCSTLLACTHGMMGVEEKLQPDKCDGLTTVGIQ